MYRKAKKCALTTVHKITTKPKAYNEAKKCKKKTTCFVLVVFQYENEAVARGHKMLQMPPVKKSWELGDTAKSHVITKTDDIAQWDAESDSSYVFTDITYGLPRRVSITITI